MGEITDGLSNSLAVAESPDFPEEEDGYWASGVHCISHDVGTINSEINGITSLHPGGAHVAFADGSTTFLTEDTEPLVIGAFCTIAADDNLSR